MKTLVIGFGSIGNRHARVLTDLNHEVAAVSRRPVRDYPCFNRLEIALAEWSPDYVVVCSKTSEHHEDVAALGRLGFAGRVLVEKPLFDCLREIPRSSFSLTAVAYNLRFHPLLQDLKRLIASERVVSATAYVGQYLPNWRPQSDYRNSYSARRSEGGGVLRDLSHEIDYCNWLFGRWTSLTALGGHLSDLSIETDDVFSLMMETRHCRSLTIHLNYLEKTPRREIIVNTDLHTVRADLIDGVLEIDGSIHCRRRTERNDTYFAEHRAMINGDTQTLCSVAEGLEVLATIAAAEKSAAARIWVHR